MQTNAIHIAIIDDHALFRKGICSILDKVSEFKIALDTDDPDHLLKVLDEKEIHIVIVDIKMPKMSGFDLTALISKKFPLVKVIALSMFKDEAPIIQMLRAGAKGYLVKGCEPWELKEAIKDVHEKGFYSGDVMSRTLINRVSSKDDLILKDYEVEFLNQCCTEKTYKEIALEMNVSPRTIDGYRDRLFEKLNIKSRTGLVLYAIRSGICII
ncbi:MAG: response regulator transcription factor [Bacteroidota bacterium]